MSRRFVAHLAPAGSLLGLGDGVQGAKDARGMVKITGRFKELIIGAGGASFFLFFPSPLRCSSVWWRRQWIRTLPRGHVPCATAGPLIWCDGCFFVLFEVVQIAWLSGSMCGHSP